MTASGTGSAGTPSDPNGALERFERAVLDALNDPGFSGVYLGPWWNLPMRLATPATQGWKRAALERRPGAGAVHWGHLFLVWAPGGRSIDLQPEEAGPGGVRGGELPVERHRLERGERDLWLLARASAYGTRSRLAALADRLAATYASGPGGSGRV